MSERTSCRANQAAGTGAGTGTGTGMGGGISVGKMVLIGVLAAGAYGAYFGYCRYQAAVKERAFSEAALGLKQQLMRVEGPLRPEHVRQAVLALAQKADVEPDASSINVRLEPLTAANTHLLPELAQRALAIVGKLPRHRAPRTLAGFSARFTARHGVAKVPFEHQRYTWIE